MAAVQPQAGIDIFERILAASGGLVALACGDVAQLVEQFRAIARHTGQSVYLWREAEGLASLRDAGLRVPDCQRLDQALRYMQQSMHFGVYLLDGISLPLSPADAALLRQLARQRGSRPRRIVLLNAPEALLDYLGPRVGRLDDAPPRFPRPRLRDGRWLVQGS